MAGTVSAPMPHRLPPPRAPERPRSEAAAPPAQGFLVGANLPWITYGTDFGANAWQPEGGLSQPERKARLDATLDKLAATGVRSVRWWLLSDGRAGVRFAPDGTPRGLDPSVFKDMDVAIAALRARGMTATFTVIDFGWLKAARHTNGVQLGGHADVISEPSKRKAYFEQVLKPILMRYGQEPAIEAWDLINEPEWEVFGKGSLNPFDVTPGTMRDFIREGAAYVHRYAQQPVTVGSASTRWLPMVQGLGLDFYAPHWYDHFQWVAPLGRSVEALHADRPVILGEYPTKGSKRDAATIMETVRAAGYRGAYAWSANATDGSTDFKAAAPALKRMSESQGGVLGRDVLQLSR